MTKTLTGYGVIFCQGVRTKTS